jgi:hypothetical protein
MLRFEVGTADLVQSRFALSPAFELCGLLRVLSGHTRQRLPPAWSARLRPTFVQLRRDTDLDAVLALHTPTFGADFVTPPPRSLAQTWEDDVAAIRRTSLSTAQDQIARCLGVRPTSDPRVLSTLHSDEVVARVAAAMDHAWQNLIARDWPQLRAIAERDVVHRAGQLGRWGWAAALDGLHSNVRWRADGIDILNSSAHTTVTLAGEGLLFIPSIFVWPRLSTQLDYAWSKALVYPARGTSALWETASYPTPDALAGLVGRSRARLLSALDRSPSCVRLASSAVRGRADQFFTTARPSATHSARARTSQTPDPTICLSLQFGRHRFLNDLPMEMLERGERAGLPTAGTGLLARHLPPRLRYARADRSARGLPAPCPGHPADRRGAGPERAAHGRVPLPDRRLRT